MIGIQFRGDWQAILYVNKIEEWKGSQASAVGKKQHIEAEYVLNLLCKLNI